MKIIKITEKGLGPSLPGKQKYFSEPTVNMFRIFAFNCIIYKQKSFPLAAFDKKCAFDCMCKYTRHPCDYVYI